MRHFIVLALVGSAIAALQGCDRSAVYAQDPRGHPNPHAKDGSKGAAPFVAKHIEKKATITLHGDIETVWPLFDPINESKWSPAWDPEILHPSNRVVQEGMVFRTHGGMVWVVSQYDSKKHRITYTVNHPEKVHTIDVQCTKHGKSITDATITYSFVGLTARGNELIESYATWLFANDLQDSQLAINRYLETGESFQHDQHASEHGQRDDGQHNAQGSYGEPTGTSRAAEVVGGRSNFSTIGFEERHEATVPFPVADVLPLFEPEGRHLIYSWWDPTVLREPKGETLEGLVTVSTMHSHDIYLIVTEHKPDRGYIQYLVLWDDFELQRIDITCVEGKTKGSTKVVWKERNAGLHDNGVSMVTEFVEGGHLKSVVGRYAQRATEYLRDKK